MASELWALSVNVVLSSFTESRSTSTLMWSLAKCQQDDSVNTLCSHAMLYWSEATYRCCNTLCVGTTFCEPHIQPNMLALAMALLLTLLLVLPALLGLYRPFRLCLTPYLWRLI